jgi:polyhydroxybutyrate depolymerase
MNDFKLRCAFVNAAAQAVLWAAACGFCAPVAAAEFRLEPASRTLIGVDQAITVFPVFQQRLSDPYPRYVDPSQVAWTSSQPACASVSGQGVVTGKSECGTVIEARYRGLDSRLAVRVSGRWIKRSVAVPGQSMRRYAIYMPKLDADADADADAGADADAALRPALIAMHGGGGTAMSQAATSQLTESAQEHQVYAAFLEGSGLIQTFNAGACCGAAQSRQVDDVEYVRRVIDDMAKNDPIDTTKILATGFSNGSMMAHRLACALADRIAAIAAVGGGSGQFDARSNEYYRCTPARPIPVLHLHSGNDRNYPFEGGRGDDGAGTLFYAIDATIADWRRRNNVSDEARTERLTRTTSCDHYESPANPRKPSARVTLCKTDPVDVYDAANGIVFGGGHSWPGGVKSRSPSSDVPPTDFDANAFIWKFVGWP